MCFKEFLGYECGHCSYPVLRPCPLTTMQGRNPICPVQAQRQFLPMTFCPSCDRIIHGRHVMIQEAEHHFYHMRGACGCSVRFPRGTEPWMCGADERLVYAHDGKDVGRAGSSKETAAAATSHRSSGEPWVTCACAEDSRMNPSGAESASRPRTMVEPESYAKVWTDQKNTATSTTGNSSTNIRAQPSSRQEHHQAAYVYGPAPANVLLARGPSTTSPLPERRLPGTDPALHVGRAKPSNGNSRIRNTPRAVEIIESNGCTVRAVVRQASLFGAEWLDDHAELHDNGRCDCGVLFVPYQVQDLDGERGSHNIKGDEPGSKDLDANELQSKRKTERSAPATPAGQLVALGTSGVSTMAIKAPGSDAAMTVETPSQPTNTSTTHTITLETVISGGYPSILPPILPYTWVDDCPAPNSTTPTAGLAPTTTASSPTMPCHQQASHAANSVTMGAVAVPVSTTETFG